MTADLRYHVPKNQCYEGSGGRQSGRVHLHVTEDLFSPPLVRRANRKDAGMILYIMPAEMSDGSPFPGLYDAVTEDTVRTYHDFTRPQIEALAAENGWQIEPYNTSKAFPDEGERP